MPAGQSNARSVRAGINIILSNGDVKNMDAPEEDHNTHDSEDLLFLVREAWDLGKYQVDTDAYADCISQIKEFPENEILTAILNATPDCTSDNVLSLSYLLDLLSDAKTARTQILAKIGQTPPDAPNYCPLAFLASQVEEKIYDDPAMAEKLIDNLFSGKRERYSAFLNDLITAASVASAVSQKLAEIAREEEHKRVLKQEQEQLWVQQNASKILRLKISLSDIRPSIWRVIEVPATCTFWDLHIAIQDAFPWDGTQSHMFLAGQRGTRAKFTIGLPPATPTLAFLLDPFDYFENEEVIGKWIFPHHPTLQYINGSEGPWVHTIKLQQILPLDSTMTYPRCPSGCRAAPPPGSGGPQDYRKWNRQRNCTNEEKIADNEFDTDTIVDDPWDGFDPEDFTPQQVRFRDPQIGRAHV